METNLIEENSIYFSARICLFGSVLCISVFTVWVNWKVCCLKCLQHICCSSYTQPVVELVGMFLSFGIFPFRKAHIKSISHRRISVTTAQKSHASTIACWKLLSICGITLFNSIDFYSNLCISKHRAKSNIWSSNKYLHFLRISTFIRAEL